MKKDHVLCLVMGNFAYFTNKPLEEQWGDDWNDAPYEHNAETPYEDKPGQIVTLAFTAPLETPAWNAINSNYSVQTINRRVVPWLADCYGDGKSIRIWAGTPLAEFKRLVWESGGKIYTRESPVF